MFYFDLIVFEAVWNIFVILVTPMEELPLPYKSGWVVQKLMRIKGMGIVYIITSGRLA